MEIKYTDTIMSKNNQDIESLKKRLSNLERIVKELFAMTALGIVLLWLAGCSGWTYNGIRGEDLKHLNGKHVVGFAGAYAVHCASHLLTAEMMGKDWTFDGFSEIVDGPMTGSQAQWFARSGYVGQLAVGYGLKIVGAHNNYTIGYNAGCMTQIMLYPATRNWSPGVGDDLAMIGANGGNEWAEWGVYSALAVGLNLSE